MKPRGYVPVRIHLLCAPVAGFATHVTNRLMTMPRRRMQIHQKSLISCNRCLLTKGFQIALTTTEQDLNPLNRHVPGAGHQINLVGKCNFWCRRMLFSSSATRGNLPRRTLDHWDEGCCVNKLVNLAGRSFSTSDRSGNAVFQTLSCLL
ncbi:uncharacterized protein LOC129754571 [Uranotaenia lowii]|uniref:uncharacterized protein LOC129754571 n=1 Tax=Uranotaenia lowii TaxID=190385 RepID=UPI002479E563|nr:uncharacterized protein LOC129754571 [Uranotaenia lowii]